MKNLLSLFIFLCILSNHKVMAIGCNFGITNSTTIGATHSFTLGQGPWGPRKYTFNFGDGTSNIAYSTPTNSVYMTHTYSLNGVYSMTINAQDSLGGGCLSYGIFTVSVTGITPTCQAQFSYGIDTANCQIQFNNQSSMATAYYWLFSNGNTSSSTSPFTSIANLSVISATLYAYNSGQQCATSAATISIAQNPCYTVNFKRTLPDMGITIMEKSKDEIEVVLSGSIFCELSIMDSRGLQLSSLKIDSRLLEIKTSGFPSGLYYLLFQGPGGTAVKKIVK